MGDISYFEIALRNAYDRTLSNNFQGTAHWLFDENSPVRKPILHKSHRGIERDVNLVNRRSIEQARARAHDPSDPNQVISNLTLGFWVHMSDRMHEREVWIPYLHQTWPSPTSRKTLHQEILAIDGVRNRAAHHERLFKPSKVELLPSSVANSLSELFRSFCPEAHEFLYGANGRNNAQTFLRDSPPPIEVDI